MSVRIFTTERLCSESARQRFGVSVITTALCAGLLLAPSTSAQQTNRSANRQDDRPSTKETTLDLAKADQFLRLEATHPEEVRVDQPFQFEVRITNTAENVVFHDVKIGHRGDSSLEIESAQLAPASGQRQEGSTTSAQRNASAQEHAEAQQAQAEEEKKQQEQGNEQNSEHQQQEEQQQQQQQEKEQQQPQDSQQAQAASGASEGAYAKVWTIETLKPGQSRVLQVTASSSQEGSVDACLALVSYTPSICLTTKFVKPELEVAKRGPERATICDQIEYEYFVKNAGSGTIEQFTIEDRLGEGLVTIEGDEQLKFRVEGGLKAGETRKFVAKLRATQAGKFASRAIARDSEGQETRSQTVETQVVAPELAVAVDGPEAVYLDRPATYSVRVTNHGEAPAEMTRLVLHYPAAMRLARATRPQASDRAVERHSQSSQNTSEAQQQQQQAQQQQAQQQQAQQQQQQQARQQTAANRAQRDAQNSARTQDWEIGTLEPGETRLVRVTFRAGQGEQVDLRAEALSYCGRDKEMQTSLAQAAQQTEIISLPALALSVIDEKDPVPAKDELNYRVLVVNEGTAPDKDIRVSVTLPEGFEFVSAEGPTDATSEGGEVTFDTIEQLGPGQKAQWRLRTKAMGEGDVAIKASLESEALSRAVTADEPTTVFTSAPASESADDKDAKAKQEQNQQERKEQEKKEQEQTEAEKEQQKERQENEEPSDEQSEADAASARSSEN